MAFSYPAIDQLLNHGARLRNRDVLNGEIESVLASQDVAVWVERLNHAGVPCGPVLDLEQVFRDPQVLARDMLVQLSHPEVGTFQTTGLPVKLSRNPGRIERRPPLHGEHTEEILRELGVAAEEVADLKRERIGKGRVHPNGRLRRYDRGHGLACGQRADLVEHNQAVQLRAHEGIGRLHAQLELEEASRFGHGELDLGIRTPG